MAKLFSGQNPIVRGPKRNDGKAFAYGVPFAGVHVHARTREVRVPRLLGAFAAGTIVSYRTAHSQYMGGMTWGLSFALHEQTEIDLSVARYVNDNLSEYLIPVDADIGRVEVVPGRDDEVNPLGIMGIGEIGMVGFNAAIANAVFHATGRRRRDLPIGIEHLSLEAQVAWAASATNRETRALLGARHTAR